MGPKIESLLKAAKKKVFEMHLQHMRDNNPNNLQLHHP